MVGFDDCFYCVKQASSKCNRDRILTSTIATKVKLGVFSSSYAKPYLHYSHKDPAKNIPLFACRSELSGKKLPSS